MVTETETLTSTLHHNRFTYLVYVFLLPSYIYIYCHPQTDCFVLSELFSVARHAGRSKPGSKPVQLYVRLSFRPFGHKADHVGKGNFKVFILETAVAAFVYIFYTLSATRVLNSYEELCITLGAADNSFARLLNPHW